MCGIFGAFGTDISKDKIKILSVLNESRGKDSTGFYYGNTIYRDAQRSSDATMALMSMFRPKKHKLILGHTRLATKGKVNVENAHPFDIRGVVGVHNGQVYNDDDMQAKWNLKYEVDSQTLIDCLSRGIKGYDRLKELNFYAGLAWVDLNEIPEDEWRTGYHLKLMTYKHTLYYGRDKRGTVYFSSDDDHLKYVVPKVKKVKESRVYTFKRNGSVHVRKIQGIASEVTSAVTTYRKGFSHDYTHAYGSAADYEGTGYTWPGEEEAGVKGNEGKHDKKDKVEETTELYFCNVCDTMVKEEDIENLEVHAACKTELDSASIPNQELGVWENDSK